MLDKKTLNILKETVEKLNQSENTLDKATAGRIIPTPQFTWKPKIIVKPKDKK